MGVETGTQEGIELNLAGSLGAVKWQGFRKGQVGKGQAKAWRHASLWSVVDPNVCCCGPWDTKAG